MCVQKALLFVACALMHSGNFAAVRYPRVDQDPERNFAAVRYPRVDQDPESTSQNVSAEPAGAENVSDVGCSEPDYKFEIGFTLGAKGNQVKGSRVEVQDVLDHAGGSVVGRLWKFHHEKGVTTLTSSIGKKGHRITQAGKLQAKIQGELLTFEEGKYRGGAKETQRRAQVPLALGGMCCTNVVLGGVVALVNWPVTWPVGAAILCCGTAGVMNDCMSNRTYVQAVDDHEFVEKSGNQTSDLDEDDGEAKPSRYQAQIARQKLIELLELY
eukprot:TRINITY_DN20709_c0_g2_i1.p1 TRINITY_DN20709_c0_g2~~TRINITY_DN20709_c0_g2_i1.p1  ORF type:complete len:270 (+),score=28.33 TRINITY_DN20709_c0_g2_i1:76-885(+)